MTWKKFLPVYQRIESEFCELTYDVELADAHLDVYSIRFADLILRIGAESENVAKAILATNPTGFGLDPDKIPHLNFPRVGDALSVQMGTFRVHAKTISLIWPYHSLSQGKQTVRPFDTWRENCGGTGNCGRGKPCKAKEPCSENPAWYASYNSVKHDRVKSMHNATLGAVYHGLAGLLILNATLVSLDAEPDPRTAMAPLTEWKQKLSKVFHASRLADQLKLDRDRS